MPSHAAAVVQRAHAAFNAGDVEEFVSLWDPNAEFRPAMEAGMQGDDGAVYRGHDGLREWWGLTREPWDRVGTHIIAIREVDENRVLVEMLIRARGRASDVELEQEAFQLMTVREGLLVSGHTTFDRAEALAFAGLSGDWSGS